MLCAMLIGYPTIAVLIGLGRSFQGGFALWYFGLMSTSWIVIFVALLMVNPKREVFTVGLALACTVFPWMWGESIRAQREFRNAEKALIADIKAGLPISAIAARNNLGFSEQTLQALKRLDAYPFRHIPDDPDYRLVAIDPKNAEPVNAHLADDCLKLTGSDSGVRFRLKERVRVAVLRVRFDLLTDSRSNDFRLFLVDEELPCGPENMTVTRKNAYFWRPTHRYGAELTFWIDRTITSITICPSAAPGRFRIHSLELLCED